MIVQGYINSGRPIAELAPYVAQAVYPGFIVAFLRGWSRSSRRAAAAPR